MRPRRDERGQRQRTAHVMLAAMNAGEPIMTLRATGSTITRASRPGDGALTTGLRPRGSDSELRAACDCDDMHGTLSAMNSASDPSPRQLLGVGLVSATLLMTELALTRIFSVVMYYHFAFLAISIALFGLSASGVFAYVARRRLAAHETAPLLSAASLVYAACTDPVAVPARAAPRRA